MHSITGKLTKAANIFQAGESTGFGVRLGVKYRDPKTKQDEWTNYQAAIFAKSPNQISFYQSVLVEGAIIEVSAEQLKINSFDGDQGPVLSIDMLNARLGYVNAPQQQNSSQGFQQQAAPQQQGGFQNNQQQSGGFQNQNQQSGYQQAKQGGFNQQQANQNHQLNQGQQQAPQFDDDIAF